MTEPTNSASLPLGIAIGLSFGSAIGIALDNLALGMSVGILFGVAIGMTRVIGGKKPAEPESPEQDS